MCQPKPTKQNSEHLAEHHLLLGMGCWPLVTLAVGFMTDMKSLKKQSSHAYGQVQCKTSVSQTCLGTGGEEVFA